MSDVEVSADVRDIVGLTRPRGIAVAIVFMAAVVCFALVNSAQTTNPLINALAFVPMFLAWAGLAFFPGDPLPAKYATVALGFVLLSVALFLSQAAFEPGYPVHLWPALPAVIFLTFLCTRGPIMWSWVGLVVIGVLIATWTLVRAGSFAMGIGLWGINVAPLLMATFFARVMRPMARFVVELRTETNRLAAAQSAASAREAERSAQLDALEASVGPILGQLATGAPIDDEMRRECALLEARLRDGLRARVLLDDGVPNAARTARERGAMVVLLDDGGADELDSGLLHKIRSTVASELDQVTSGKVTARILPPGRSLVATVHVRTRDSERRVAVDRTGMVVVDV